MKPSFHHRLVNGPFEDPVLYVRLFREKRALMFDCGDISTLSLSQMLRVTDLFITHTHIDHFIGFDRLLRSALSRERPLRIYGPHGIAEAVEGKLRGYTWNLIRGYPMEIEVNAVGSEMIARTAYRASNGLEREELESAQFNGTVLREPSFKVRAVGLEHGITTLAYSLEEEFHINIIKNALADMGVQPGAWLRELKHAIWENRPEETVIDTGAGTRTLRELSSLVSISRGQKLCYVTDASPTEENIAMASALAQGASTLYCESFFMSGERERAVERNHLTASDAAEIARRAGAATLVPMHFSARYKGRGTDPGQEALGLFRPE